MPAGGPASALRNWHERPGLIQRWTALSRRLLVWLPPERMRLVLALAAVVLCFEKAWRRRDELPQSQGWIALVLAAALLALAYLVYVAARNFQRLPRAVRRRPQIALHALLWLLLAAWWLAPNELVDWKPVALLAVALFARVAWRLGYVLKSGQRGKAQKTRFADHLFTLWPLWGGNNTPFGKGYDYLVRHQARTPEELARSQLAGVKLILLGLVWHGARYAMDGLVYGDPENRVRALCGGWTLDVPRLSGLVRRREELSGAMAWLGIYCELVASTLRIASNGHMYIGVLRLLGFNVFRNTYKPLLAQSIVDFWNRYYYYFKELLVEFFFYPTFARFSVRPWLRMLLAVFAAAFVGNLYFHLLGDESLLVGGDLAQAWEELRSRVLYCFLLASGIYVSMLREERRRGAAAAAPPGRARVILRIALVWTFFAVIHVWAQPGLKPTFEERTRFVLSLAGL